MSLKLWCHGFPLLTGRGLASVSIFRAAPLLCPAAPHSPGAGAAMGPPESSSLLISSRGQRLPFPVLLISSFEVKKRHGTS